MIVTTSWDDGYALDMKILRLLERYRLRGTFYICPQIQHGEKMLSRTDIRTLNNEQQVGAHTMTHPKLTAIERQDAMREITESKTWIEHLTNQECTMFCYPKGEYDDPISKMVQDAGFKGARTVEQHCFEAKNPFALPTTLQLYPFPIRKSYRQLRQYIDPFGPLRVKYRHLRTLGIPLASMRSWLPLAKALFLHGYVRDASFFHLWGHSEEIERWNLWDDLEALLRFIRGHEHVQPMTNGDWAITLSRQS